MQPSFDFRSAFISDLHLGTPDCKADYLLDFLHRVSARQWYLVGDIIDLEYLSRRSAWTSRHSAVVARLFELASQGSRVVYVPGNHDAPLRALDGQTLHGIEVHRQFVHQCADGRRFRVSHCDEFDGDTHPGGWEQHIGEFGYQLLSLGNRWVNGLRRGVSRPYWPMAVVAKSRFSKVRDYVGRFEQCAAERARSEGLDGYIGGHVHFCGMRSIDGVLYCNDGDWTDHCTALVEDYDGALDLLHWSDRCGRLRDQAFYAESAPSLPAGILAQLAAVHAEPASQRAIARSA